MEIKQTIRSEWLTISLSTAAAIVAYRISGTLVDFLFLSLNIISFGWKFHFGLIFGLFFAILWAIWQHKFLQNQSLKINHIFLAVFVILAIFPLQFQSGFDLVEVPPEAYTPATNISPVNIVCKLIDGEMIEENEVLNNSHFSRAVPFARTGESYQIRLFLTLEGQQVVERITTRNIGKRLGFWVDGDLKCSPEIHSKIVQDFILLPFDQSLSEAIRLAEGITFEGL